MSKRLLLAGAAVIAAGGANLSWDWYRGRDLVLSQRPPVASATLAIPNQDSSIGIRVHVPMAALQAVIDAQIPPSFRFGGNGDDACADLRFLGKHCVGTRYDATVTKAGALQLTASANALQATLPVSISGNGGFRGDGAALLRLDAKNFRAGLNAILNAAVDLDPTWCPVINASASFNWTSDPRVEIVGSVWVTVRDQVEGPLRGELNKVPDRIRAAIPCATVQTEIRRAWRAYSIPVDVGQGQTLHIRLDPTSVGFSGITVAPDHIRIGIALRATTSVATTAGSEDAKADLPPLVRVPDEPGRISLAVPVRAGYNALRSALLREISGKTYTTATPAGLVTASILDLSIYPTDNGRVAVGATFTADVPGRVFDVGGRVFLTARPVVEEQTLRLTDIAFTRALDNSIWNVASAVFEREIRDAIERGGRVDLAPLTRQAADAVTAATSDPAKTGGVALRISNLTVTVEQVVPEADNLAALVRIGAIAEAEVRSIQQ